MPAQRTKYQKAIFKEMSGFWCSKKRKERVIRKPWRHELEKGVVKVRFLQYVYPDDPMCPQIFFDWCEEKGLKKYTRKART